MGTWKRKTIGELCDLGKGEVKTGPFGSQLHQSDYSDEGTPVVMPADIVGDAISEDRIARVSDTHVDRLAKHKLSRGDIIYGRRGDIGRQALVREKNAGWLCGTGCLRITLGEAELIPEFLHLYLRMPEIVGWIQNQAIGATMPNLNTQILRRVPVFYPESKEEQEKIVSFSFAYDDLIENNKGRIALLEKMAEELYREWFVRFRFPGYQTAEFEKGIPKGWDAEPFSELVSINPTERPHRDDEKPYVGMEALSTDSMYFKSEERRQGNAGSKFRNGDTLFPRITPCLENGKRGFVMALGDDEIGTGSTEFVVFRQKVLTPEYIYLLSIFEPFRTHAEISMVGASGRQRVAENCFSFFLVPTPPEAVLVEFTKIVRPLFDQIKTLSEANHTLARTRDQLLPRLISGKLAVDELDIQFPPSMQEDEAA